MEQNGQTETTQTNGVESEVKIVLTKEKSVEEAHFNNSDEINNTNAEPDVVVNLQTQSEEETQIQTTETVDSGSEHEQEDTESSKSSTTEVDNADKLNEKQDVDETPPEPIASVEPLGSAEPKASIESNASVGQDEKDTVVKGNAVAVKNHISSNVNQAEEEEEQTEVVGENKEADEIQEESAKDEEEEGTKKENAHEGFETPQEQPETSKPTDNSPSNLKQEASELDGPQQPSDKEPEVLSSTQGTNQVMVSNTIKEIISDIDSNIREQERVSLLKQEELRLLEKQHELSRQIQEQQQLVQKLATQSDFMQQKYDQQQQKPTQPTQLQQFQRQQQYQLPQQQQHHLSHQQQYQLPQQQQHHLSQQQQNPLQRQDIQQFQRPLATAEKYTTHEESRDGNTLTKTTTSYETKESSNVSKHVDLQKIFTPATDGEEILPKNRRLENGPKDISEPDKALPPGKLYASSAFYSPNLHPTVEDQVELARRISHSLSDISNHQSKGQSMYVNRKKRSVKWVHEGPAGASTQDEKYCEEQQKENTEITATKTSELEFENSTRTPLEKVPLRLLMNPRGQVRDYSSLHESLNVETGLMSPEKCAELVTALQTHKGRGAELFAKRRKKAEKWVVDETPASTHSPSGLPDYHPQQAPPPKPPTSPNLFPAYSEAGKHRVQLNMHQEQLLEKYAKPGIKVVKSPWEAALESGSAATAFVEETSKPYQKPTSSPPSKMLQQDYNRSYQASPSRYETSNVNQQQYQTNKASSYNPQRDLAYKPSLPQGWKAPAVSLPKGHLEDIYMKESSNQSFHLNEFAQNESENSSLSHGTEHESNLEIIGYNTSHFEQTSRINIVSLEENISSIGSINSLDFIEPEPNKPQSNENTTSKKYENNVYKESEDKQKYTRVDVRRQLEELERQQQELALIKIKEEHFLKKRNRNARSWKWQQKQNHMEKLGPELRSNQVDEANSARDHPQGQEIEENENNEYVKVAVRDLIESFEQQTISTMETDAKETHFAPIITSEDEKYSKELYIPKEIPLESYAPPPTVDIQPNGYISYNRGQTPKPNTWTSSVSPGPPFDKKADFDYSSSSAPGSYFPTTNKTAYKNDFVNGSKNFPITTPKQQHWDPKSYQKVPTAGTQRVPQVTFNPSPLPYQKLAKFSGSENDEVNHKQKNSPYLQPSVNTRVRNTSPTPFGSQKRQQQQPEQQPHHFPTQNECNSSYHPPFVASQGNTHDLMHGPTFNNSARGWHTTRGKSIPHYIKPRAPYIIDNSIPYSDF